MHYILTHVQPARVYNLMYNLVQKSISNSFTYVLMPGLVDDIHVLYSMLEH